MNQTKTRRSRAVIRDLGAHDNTLSQDQKDFLDTQGYLPLPGVLDAQDLQAFRQRIAELLEAEGELAGSECHYEAGTDRLSNLVDKGALFQRCLSEPRLLAAIDHVLGPDFKLSSLNCRCALPGAGLQGLHVDGGLAGRPGDYRWCNSIWLLDDFTPENGATRIVPGTHKIGKVPQDEMKDTTADHPEQALIQAPAGTVVVFNSHLWHGGTLNRTDKPRRAIHCYWVRRDMEQQVCQREHLNPSTLKQLSPSLKHLLDV